jgi:hypothetical protein
MPLNSINCDTDNLPKSIKLLLTLAKMRLHKATALSSLLPELKNCQ